MEKVFKISFTKDSNNNYTYNQKDIDRLNTHLAENGGNEFYKILETKNGDVLVFVADCEKTFEI